MGKGASCHTWRLDSPQFGRIYWRILLRIWIFCSITWHKSSLFYSWASVLRAVTEGPRKPLTKDVPETQPWATLTSRTLKGRTSCCSSPGCSVVKPVRGWGLCVWLWWTLSSHCSTEGPSPSAPFALLPDTDGDADSFPACCCLCSVGRYMGERITKPATVNSVKREWTSASVMN